MSATPPPPPAGSNYSAPQPPLSPQDEKLWAILSHVLGIFFGWISALIVYLVFKDRGPFVNQHSKAELNFQITIVIAYVAVFILTLISFGLLFFLYFIPVVVVVVFEIIAAMRANEGQPYEFPIAIKFIK